jgi:serralysin
VRIALDSQRIAERQKSEAVSGAAEALSHLISASARTQRTEGSQVSATIQHIITESTSGGRNFWPNGSTLKVRFLDGDSAIHARVARYAGEWSQYANIKFDFAPQPTDRADIRITFATPASWSLIGTQARDAPPQEPTMNLGAAAATRPTETRRLVLYEFGHALGLVHELQNPEADIPWDTAAVFQYFARRYGYTKRMVRENVLQKYDSSIGYRREFDPTSLMHAFRIPAEITGGRYDIKPGRELSESDKRLIRRIYPGAGAEP